MRKADRDGDGKAPRYSKEVEAILERVYALANDLQRLTPAKATELQGALDRITAYALIVGDDIEAPLHDDPIIDWTLTELSLCDGVTDVLTAAFEMTARSNDVIEMAFRADGDCSTAERYRAVVAERKAGK
jgi:hypothetical protein